MQDKLWQGLREVLEALQAGTTVVWHLQRVVAKKKDPLSHVCFLDVLVKQNENLLTERFWWVATGGGIVGSEALRALKALPLGIC